jgi:hypothetical protein
MGLSGKHTEHPDSILRIHGLAQCFLPERNEGIRSKNKGSGVRFGRGLRLPEGKNSHSFTRRKGTGFIYVRSVCFKYKTDPVQQFAATRRPRREHEVFQMGTPSIVNIKPSYYIITMNEIKVKLTNALAGLYNVVINKSGGESSS